MRLLPERAAAEALPRDDPHERLFEPTSERCRRLAVGRRSRRRRPAPLRETHCWRSSASAAAARGGRRAPADRSRAALPVRARNAGPVPAAEAGQGELAGPRGQTLLGAGRRRFRPRGTAASEAREPDARARSLLEQRCVASRRVRARPAVLERNPAKAKHYDRARRQHRPRRHRAAGAAHLRAGSGLGRVEAHLGGADGITVHLREDRRHIQDEDVRRLRELTHIKLNLEMAATDEMVAIALPHQARDGDAGARRAPRDHDRRRPRHRRPEAETEGRDREARRRRHRHKRVHRRRHRQVEAAARIGARVCEIHTGPYAHAFHPKGRDAEARR